MRSRLIIALLVTIAALAVRAHGQDGSAEQTVTNASNIGTPANGIYSGSDFESVQLNNGNLHIEIPVWSLHGRGLGTGASFVYDSSGWGNTHTHCVHMTG